MNDFVALLIAAAAFCTATVASKIAVALVVARVGHGTIPLVGEWPPLIGLALAAVVYGRVRGGTPTA